MTAVIATGTLMTIPLAGFTHGTPPERYRASDAALAPEERLAPPAVKPGPDGELASRGGAAATRGPSADGELSTVATIEDLAIVAPSSETELVGFHESYSAAAVELEPAEPPTESHGHGEVPPSDVAAGDDTMAGIVLPTRHRAGAPTSAVDIAVAEEADVVAPISGEVVSVSPYFLYGQHPDVRIDVVPEARPDLRVVIIHVSDVTVEAGDRIVAGETVIAGEATAFPFESQIDRFVREQHGEASPHVHLEVTRVGG